MCGEHLFCLLAQGPAPAQYFICIVLCTFLAGINIFLQKPNFVRAQMCLWRGFSNPSVGESGPQGTKRSL